MRNENKKFFIGLSLLSVLLVTMLVNSRFWSRVGNSNSVALRGLASTADMRLAFDDSQIEEKIAKRLAHADKREIASLGTSASAFDQLAFGLLEGKYAIRLKNGGIQEIQFSDATISGDKPKYITSREEFLKQHRHLFAVDFDRTQKSQTKEGQETYKLLNNSDQQVGEVLFKLDEYGRLISLKVEAKSNTHNL